MRYSIGKAWNRRTAGLVSGLLATLACPMLARAGAAPPSTDPAAACRALLAAPPPPDTRLTEAVWTPAGPQTSQSLGGHPTTLDLPAHCLVQGVVDERIGVGGRPYGVRFELRLPTSWSGRYLFQGGGGLDGLVLPAFGQVANAGAPALAKGYAVVSMDGGHEGLDAGFAADQQARLDFAYAAIGKADGAARVLVSSYYGRKPAYAYFAGCSNGGREALIAAQRYPLRFDGVVAGDPGFHLSHAAIAEAWNVQRFSAIAPKDAGGAPDLAQALSEADLKLLSDAVLADCDGLDGLKDGMIANPAACRFTPGRLACKPGGVEGRCLTPAKLATVEAVFSPIHDSRGERLYPGFPYDAGVDQPGWRIWMLGFPHGARSINQTLGAGALSLYFMTPPEPHRAAGEIDLDRAAGQVAETGAINDATSTYLTSFKAHGGKLILYQGRSDPVFSARDIEAWYDRVQQGDPGADSYARLFPVPGMNHCSGGLATDRFDVLAAIQAWVEHGRAPDSIVATGAAFPGQSRPLCPYPSYPRYVGGDPARAENFRCTLSAEARATP